MVASVTLVSRCASYGFPVPGYPIGRLIRRSPQLEVGTCEAGHG